MIGGRCEFHVAVLMAEARRRHPWRQRRRIARGRQSARPPLSCPREARGRAPDPVSRGTRRRAAVRPAHADTESLTQHGPAVGEGQRGRIARRGQCCATPCCRAIGGTKGRTPSRYTSGPGVGQQHLRRARTPRIGGERRKRRRSMLGSPASTRKAERLTTALITYGGIFVEGRGHPRVPRGRSQGRAWHRAQGCEWTSALPPPWLPQRPHELTEDRDNPLTAKAVRRPRMRTSSTRVQGPDRPLP
jgi:hypothetical protein